MDGREVFRAQKLIVSTAPLIDLATGNPKDRGFVIVHGLALGRYRRSPKIRLVNV